MLEEDCSTLVSTLVAVICVVYCAYVGLLGRGEVALFRNRQSRSVHGIC